MKNQLITFSLLTSVKAFTSLLLMILLCLQSLELCACSNKTIERNDNTSVEKSCASSSSIKDNSDEVIHSKKYNLPELNMSEHGMFIEALLKSLKVTNSQEKGPEHPIFMKMFHYESDDFVTFSFGSCIIPWNYQGYFTYNDYYCMVKTSTIESFPKCKPENNHVFAEEAEEAEESEDAIVVQRRYIDYWDVTFRIIDGRCELLSNDEGWEVHLKSREKQN